MNLTRSAGWLFFLLTPLLMSVRIQRADHDIIQARLSISSTRPASMALHQRLLADKIWVLWQQVEDRQQDSRPAGRHTGGCGYGTGSIARPMSDVVKE